MHNLTVKKVKTKLRLSRAYFRGPEFCEEYKSKVPGQIVVLKYRDTNEEPQIEQLNAA